MGSELETVTIPVVEEELKLGRETVETGRLQVRTVPEERTETIRAPLLRNQVDVERVPFDQEVTQLPPIREEGETTVIPVVEERLVKRLFLIEEVRLSRRQSTEQVEQKIKLRSQHVVVEREESSGTNQQ